MRRDTSDPGPGISRRAVLRGLAVILPPLLTIAILIWVWNAVQQYVLVPVESGARIAIAWAISDNPEDISNLNNERVVYHNNVQYRQLEHGQYVPLHVYDTVRAKLGTEPMPNTTEGIWRRYVDIMYLPPYVVIPVFLCVFVLLLYLLGKFLAGSLGRMLWNFFELVIHRLPRLIDRDEASALSLQSAAQFCFAWLPGMSFV